MEYGLWGVKFFRGESLREGTFLERKVPSLKVFPSLSHLLLTGHAVHAAEVGDQDTAYGAMLGAGIAARAFVIVDLSQVIHHGDGTCGTMLFAHLTADTAVGAVAAHRSTLVGIVATDDHAFHVGQDIDELIGACLGTQTAAYAFTGVNVGNTLLNTNGIVGTNRDAVPKTDTAVGAKP